MKSVFIALFAATISFASVQPISAAEAAKFKEKVLHAFASGTDGASPEAGLLNLKGTLYGTTYGGGGRNSGVIFSLDPDTGAETVVHSFGNGTDGLNPQASLIDVNGTLFGTTETGGGQGGGAVFALDLNTGAVTTVHGFCGQETCADGQYPQASLIDVNGTLYGTTYQGGTFGGGTVFSLDPSTGAEMVLHAFGGADGAGPHSNLIVVPSVIDLKSTLYGTTSYGGAYGQGTVYSIDPSTGVETVLHSFGNGRDGKVPYGGLISVNGTLYGTTWNGGRFTCGTYYCGAVFSLDPTTGAERVIHSFGKNTDGALPFASLIDVEGTLYGTTSYGGTYSRGTVFSINPASGAEKVLHAFADDEAANPYASLIDVNGSLYGTTESGGANGGHGTVFVLTKKH